MKYSNIKKYASTHIFALYLLFAVTGLSFFMWGSHLIKADPEIVVFNNDVPVYLDSTKTHQMFLSEMGMFESSNNYRCVNKYGYLGKYQFGKSTLKGLKIECTTQEFLDQPDLQEFAMEQNLKLNKKRLSKYIGEHQFTTFRGIFITESGVLAAAHLGGAGSVKKFFKGGKIFKDGNGVPITRYMNHFKGYNLDFK